MYILYKECIFCFNKLQFLVILVFSHEAWNRRGIGKFWERMRGYTIQTVITDNSLGEFYCEQKSNNYCGCLEEIVESRWLEGKPEKVFKPSESLSSERKCWWGTQEQISETTFLNIVKKTKYNNTSRVINLYSCKDNPLKQEN
jgi:hypothetical protein